MKKISLILLCFGFSAAYGQAVLTGTVTDNSKQPLPGVNIIIEGSSKGTTSDFDGNFSIKVSPNDVLQFSYIGFIPKNITVGNKTTINVIMEENSESLDEVIVIGYGTSSKKELVSSVASVSGKELENLPVSRVDQLLQGRASGVDVTSNNGSPGTAPTIRIRGNSSITGNNSPLYVIDGFIVGTGFNLNNINTNDIESLEVLKDASALAIYGTRGAAGVILITTKNGKNLEIGKPTITVNAYTSIDEMTNKIEILGGADYLRYVNEGSQFIPGPGIDVNGTSVPVGLTDPSIALLFNNPEEVPTVDWIDLVSEIGIKNNVDLSIAGRSENANYYTSINYFDQQGIIIGSGLERVVFRNNLDYSVSDRFKTGVRLNLSSQRRENNKVSFSEVISSVLPVRTVFDENGEFTGLNPITGSTQRNPVADSQLRVDHDLVTNLIASAYIDYELAKGLTLNSSIGATLNFFKNNRFLPGALPERIANNNQGGTGRVDVTNSKSILHENTLNFKKKYGNHKLDILGGFTWQKDTSESVRAESEGVPFDVVEFNGLEIGSDPLLNNVTSGFSKRTFLSALGRFRYVFDQKYIVELAGRNDWSSVFEVGNKGAFFPSAAVGWNIDEEDFMQNVDVFNTLKLRASFGALGEQGIGPFNSLDTFSSTFTTFNETTVAAVVLDSPSSDGLEWETTKQLDIGLEVGLLNNRISLEAGYYRKVTDDLLLRENIPGTAGNEDQLRNVGSVQNKGVEFTLNTTNMKTKDFEWNSTVILSANRSKVLDLGDETTIRLQSTGNQGGSSAALIVGQPFPVFIGAEYLGTYQDPQEIIDDNREDQSFLGSPRYTDLDGNGTINDLDSGIIGSPEADFYGSFNNTFTYKNISLNIFFQGSYGNEVFNVRTQTSFFGRGEQNLDPRVLDRWIEGVNETSDIPRAGTSTSTFNPNSSISVEDGSFLRLRTVTLSYDLPIQKTGLKDVFKSINVYATGNNLALFSRFSLGDPEVNSFSANSGFGSVSQGFASGEVPYSRSIAVGLKVEF